VAVVTYLEFAPSPALCPFVERLWVLQTGPTEEPTAAPVLPDGHAELIVHVGAPFLVLDSSGTPRRQARVLWGAQLTEAARLVSVPNALIAGARLRPQAGAALTGVPQYELAGAIHDVRSIDCSVATRVEAHLSGRTDVRDLAAAFDSVLVAICRDRHVNDIVDRAVRSAEHSRGLLRVDDLSRTAGVGGRQLERLFAHHVGLSPKAFLRVLRFQEVLAALRTPESHGWADLAVRHGFYDQAHFINDFRRFTGESPAAWEIDEASLTGIFASRSRDYRLPGSASETASNISC
jgi:AraC-like DNA-binding protein